MTEWSWIGGVSPRLWGEMQSRKYSGRNGRISQTYGTTGNGSSPPSRRLDHAAGNSAQHTGTTIEARDLHALPTAARFAAARGEVRGKFFFAGDEKFYLKGVTYGAFRPNRNGEPYPEPDVVARDFAQIAASGLNTVRTYVVPPRWLLDVAQQHGLRVIVGILWEQYECLSENARRMRDLRRRMRVAVRACAGHPAVFAYAIGNEIPASIVRWHGAKRVERLLYQLYREVKREDPAALVTYVNYPTTEYLNLPFLDFFAFNVYLESQEELEAYLARLQNLVGDRPLVLAEIGLDSRRNGERAQAEALAWQIRTVFTAGCAGACVFAWTDEWHHAGNEICDWDYGLVERNRRAKAALSAVRDAFMEVPFPAHLDWPRISVVVCSYNGARTIRDCLTGLARVEYPDFEVIVVDDGSTDDTAAIAAEFEVCLIRTVNRGLSYARNTGIRAASGDIVAFLDDDARPDPHWLQYLAHTFMSGAHAAVGGPNLAVPGDGPIAACVANAPGGPIHVLLTDREAEHVPGCNMAVRKARLHDVGGFDPQFRVAGDDVDLCWKLQARGWTIGFSPAAMVWHHRRNSVRAYWKQQLGYGKAEALLAHKWPEKYNLAGHARWAGRLYGPGLLRTLGSQRRIYHGPWGSALFQSVYETAPEGLRALLLMPEWYLALAGAGILTGLGLAMPPLLLLLPVFLLGAAATLIQAGLSASSALWAGRTAGRVHGLKLWALCTTLYLLQPIARLSGRIQHGLTPWRRRDQTGFQLPLPRTFSLWTEVWRAPAEALRDIEARFRSRTHSVQCGGNFDRWDLEGWSGLLGCVRTLMAVEEHGAGKQFFRFRVWPRVATPVLGLFVLLAAFGAVALFQRELIAAATLAGLALLLATATLLDCATATKALLSVLTDYASATSAHVVECAPAHEPGPRIASLAVRCWPGWTIQTVQPAARPYQPADMAAE